MLTHNVRNIKVQLSPTPRKTSKKYGTSTVGAGAKQCGGQHAALLFIDGRAGVPVSWSLGMLSKLGTRPFYFTSCSDCRRIPVQLLVPKKAIIFCAPTGPIPKQPPPVSPVVACLPGTWPGDIGHRGRGVLIDRYRLPLTQDHCAHRIMGSSLILH